MKRLTLFAAIAAALVTGGTPAFAETKIGIVDVRKVIEESDAGKGLTAQLKTRQEALQKEVAGLEKNLETKKQDIIAKSKGMKPEELKAKEKEFEQDFNKSRQTVLKKSTDLENQRKKSLGELQKVVLKASSDVATEKKLGLMLDRQFVVLSEESMDVTKDVLAKVNAAAKSMTLGE